MPDDIKYSGQRGEADRPEKRLREEKERIANEMEERRRKDEEPSREIDAGGDEIYSCAGRGGVGAKFCKNKAGHHEGLADIASCPSQKHSAEFVVSDRDIGIYDGVGLEQDLAAISNNQVCDCTVFADGAGSAEESLVHPFPEVSHKRFGPVG